MTFKEHFRTNFNIRLQIADRAAELSELLQSKVLKDFKADLKSFCVSRGAEFIAIDTDKSIEKMLFGELLKVGIMA